jgi:hypothetical protein
MNIGQNWTCPYCGHAQVITDERHETARKPIHVQNWEHGMAGYEFEATVCANNNCKKLSFDLALIKIKHGPQGGIVNVGGVRKWRLLPSSFAKPLPDYIPSPITRDYEEACAIRDLSPKASATLVRRCIQGIIRDFCKITDKTLDKEIKVLRQLVDSNKAPAGVQPDTVDAIDHVRQIGNIGAHMERDINIIVDVDPDEAQRLIELAELLFDEWYVAREQRTQKLIKLGVVAAQKKAQQLLPSPAETADTSK